MDKKVEIVEIAKMLVYMAEKKYEAELRIKQGEDFSSNMHNSLYYENNIKQTLISLDEETHSSVLSEVDEIAKGCKGVQTNTKIACDIIKSYKDITFESVHEPKTEEIANLLTPSELTTIYSFDEENPNAHISTSYVHSKRIEDYLTAKRYNRGDVVETFKKFGESALSTKIIEVENLPENPIFNPEDLPSSDYNDVKIERTKNVEDTEKMRQIEEDMIKTNESVSKWVAENNINSFMGDDE